MWTLQCLIYGSLATVGIQCLDLSQVLSPDDAHRYRHLNSLRFSGVLGSSSTLPLRIGIVFFSVVMIHSQVP